MINLRLEQPSCDMAKASKWIFICMTLFFFSLCSCNTMRLFTLRCCNYLLLGLWCILSHFSKALKYRYSYIHCDLSLDHLPFFLVLYLIKKAFLVWGFFSVNTHSYFFFFFNLKIINDSSFSNTSNSVSYGTNLPCNNLFSLHTGML